MGRKHRLLLFSAIALVIVAGGLVAGSFVGRELRRPPRPEKPQIDQRLALGSPMPDATFFAPYGDTIQLQDVTAGRKAILIFLSTTCTPCTDLAAEWHDVFPGFAAEYEIVGVSSESPSAVDEFVRRWDITFPVLLDHERRFSSEYRIEAAPTLLGIDENGLITFAEIGYEKDGSQAIRDLVAQF